MAPPDGIGTRIRRARERLRLSQDQLAAELGVSRNSVSAWETGRAYPQSSIGALEAVLGVDLTGGGEPRPGEDRALQHIRNTPGLDDDIADALVEMAVRMRDAKRRARREAG